MKLHGKNLIAGVPSGDFESAFRAIDPVTGSELAPEFCEAGAADIDRAIELSQEAFEKYREVGPEARAQFLERIATELEQLGDPWIERAAAETALPEERLKGERARTLGQLRLFAAVAREGSWVDARIDPAQPDRKPIARPDIRRMLVPIGPVVVFAASNFPLAFSVAGGDTAAALAAGNPVVVKAHPAHPGTSELAGRAVTAAIESCGLHRGVFSLLHGRSHEVGLRLVRHPLACAVGFTGSLRAGRALFDAAAARRSPIPVYAEMGSINPVFVLPGAARERAEALAEGLRQSVTLGVGQFCTNPGLIVGLEDEHFAGLAKKLGQLFGQAPSGTMLYPAIQKAYQETIAAVRRLNGVEVLGESPDTVSGCSVTAIALQASVETYLKHPELGAEVFGPSTLVVTGRSDRDLEALARGLDGHLTATLHGTAEDLQQYAWLVSILTQKVGRLIFNGFPTGVEVCPAMHHGGPYPATTDSHWTSVGTAAIGRFARPVCFQNFPQVALPAELRDVNERGIWRLVDGQTTHAGLSETR
ncbi:MAG: aldehyde dehydrogenase (NADP(+)) [Acidobacteriota bacterium]